MSHFADLVIAEIGRMNCNYTYFADVCGLSRREIGNIVSRKTKDVNVSTIIKICENTNITISDIFGCSNDEIFRSMIKRFSFGNGNLRFRLYEDK